jgi:putative restriction endonuclease
VNFWQPSGAREFRVLAPGEPFFFKTHYPHNRLVGGGFFSDSAQLKVTEAWEFFGEANGAASVDEMRTRIGRYRRAPIEVGDDPLIGCLFVRDIPSSQRTPLRRHRRGSPRTSCRARAMTWPTRQ